MIDKLIDDLMVKIEEHYAKEVYTFQERDVLIDALQLYKEMQVR